MLFGSKLRGPLEHLVGAEIEENVPFVRANVRHEASLALSFAAARAKEQYDRHHRPLSFDIGDNVYLRLHRGYHLPGKPPRKYSQQRAGPFKVLEKIGHLAYRLDFPPNWRIHPVVSVEHLDIRPGMDDDPFNRQVPPPGPVEVHEDGDEFEVEIILDERTDRRGRGRGRKQWLIRWKGWGAEHDSWVDQSEVFAPELVREFKERRRYRHGH